MCGHFKMRNKLMGVGIVYGFRAGISKLHTYSVGRGFASGSGRNISVEIYQEIVECLCQETASKKTQNIKYKFPVHGK